VGEIEALVEFGINGDQGGDDESAQSADDERLDRGIGQSAVSLAMCHTRSVRVLGVS
jgi:hypothetical protein